MYKPLNLPEWLLQTEMAKVKHSSFNPFYMRSVLLDTSTQYRFDQEYWAG